MPYRILHAFQIPVYNAIRERDAEFYARLEKAGFMLDFGEDGSGLFMKYLRRGSGYYIDVGASELVGDGKIKLNRGQVGRNDRGASVVLSDGTELPADLVVYATGYGSMNGWAADIICQDMADKVGKVWGLGSGTTEGSGPVGGRAAQHVEADPAGGAVVPRRQPASVAPLLAVSVAAAQGAHGGHPDTGLRAAASASPQLTLGGQCFFRVEPVHGRTRDPFASCPGMTASFAFETFEATSRIDVKPPFQIATVQ